MRVTTGRLAGRNFKESDHAPSRMKWGYLLGEDAFFGFAVSRVCGIASTLKLREGNLVLLGDVFLPQAHPLGRYKYLTN